MPINTTKTTTALEKTTTALEKFYTELLKDPMLQERLKAATDPESLSELAVELAKEKGYFFTKEEVLAAMAIEAAMGGEYVEVGDSLVVDPMAKMTIVCDVTGGY